MMLVLFALIFRAVSRRYQDDHVGLVSADGVNECLLWNNGNGNRYLSVLRFNPAD